MRIEDGIDKLLLGQYEGALSVFEECGPSPQIKKLRDLTLKCIELTTYATALSEGDLSIPVPDPDNYLSTPLKNLHTKLKRLARQLLMATTGYPVPAIDYMGDLSEGLDALFSEVLLRKRQVDYDRDHDTETGLLNRKAFMRGVYDILQAQPASVGVLFCCGLDNIKYINDTHGYECGDVYISKVVDALRTYENSSRLVARMGGNEFAVYAHGFDNEKDACAFAQDTLKTLLNTTVALPREKVRIRASCGLAVYPHDAATSDILMNYASHAMFEVRNLDRGTVMRFSPEVYRTKADLLSRQERLDELIESRLIHFSFQPIVCLRKAAIIGYEALMRPKNNIFSNPLDILSLAEAQSKLRQLEKMTFEVIFEWVYRSLARLGDKKIFFNIISLDYLNRADLQAIHPQYESVLKNVVFEILETAAVESDLLQKVNDFRHEFPAPIAIDDFGSGHSNALRLISISPDILKIDRFFISNIHNAPVTKKEFLSNILDYCRAKEIATVAEGVETYEELACVTRMGFDYVQGFYLGRPNADLSDLDPRIVEEITSFAKESLACHG